LGRRTSPQSGRIIIIIIIICPTSTKLQASDIEDKKMLKAFYSVSKLFWKETAFAFWKAMGKRCNKYVVSLVSSATMVMPMRQPISGQTPNCELQKQLELTTILFHFT